MATGVDSTTATAASALVWTWIAGNLGPISTIILMGVAMTKYVEKRNTERVDHAKKEILVSVDMKLDNLAKDIASMNQTYDLIRKYIESDIKELKGELVALKSRELGSGVIPTIDFKTRLELEREREAQLQEEMQRKQIDQAIAKRKKKWERYTESNDEENKKGNNKNNDNVQD